MAGEANDCEIELEASLISSLRTKMDAIRPRRSGVELSTIFPVPQNIRKANPEAYEPKIVSFGPYHHGQPHLQQMEETKLLYLKKLLRRNPSVPLESYLQTLKRLESRARSSYSDKIAMDCNDFIQMMLLDASFITELFLMHIDISLMKEATEEEEYDDPILNTSWILPLVEFDMLMLENQIPFFILEEFFDMAASPIQTESYTLIDVALEFFDDLFPSDKKRLPTESTPQTHHFLHLFHSCILPPQNESEIRRGRKMNIKFLSGLYRYLISSLSSSRGEDHEPIPPPPATPESIPCATMLREAGVKFRKKEDAGTFLDVRFAKGKLEIPPLRVYDHTESLFRNLIAFEQCFPAAGNHVTAYAVFADCLVDTGSDVALLHHAGAIVNGLGNDDETAELFNKLCKEVAIDYDDCYLSELFKDVKKHCDSRPNRWRAKLMHDYFSSPWAALSLVGALFLLFLTVAQTVLAFLAYLQPPN
ncbi:UPF0481 protein [Apostasia shenzhenica]|uniref:UPF0481 protein n=1 Tax=Apostasia shenzhenica TaxID=1088818 RepID=A0A2I0A6Q1_9ASPA|nr:UPF0481 protein [Apostasia shenzhenica]